MELDYASNRSLFGSESTTELFFADHLVISIGMPLGWIAGVTAATVLLVAVTIGMIRGKRDAIEEG